MKKFIIIVKSEIQRQFAHRANIFSHIVGNSMGLFAQLIVWYVAFQEREIIRGYNFEEMVSYIVIGWIIWFVTTSYGFEVIIAREIHLGTLTNIIIKPVHYFKYALAVALGRVTIAFGVVIFQTIIFIFLFRDYFVGDLDALKVLTLLMMIFMIFIIRLLIAYITGFVAFWTTEISGFYKLVRVFIGVFSGSYFPLTILPAFILKLFLVLPFAYTFFYPVQYYLGKVDFNGALKGLGIQVIWAIILFLIAKFVWSRGLKKYESVGA